MKRLLAIVAAGALFAGCAESDVEQFGRVAAEACGDGNVASVNVDEPEGFVCRGEE